MLALEVDICEVARAEARVKEASLGWGHVDVLINNAGDLSPSKLHPLRMSDMDAWWGTSEVNAKGFHLVVRALLPLLLPGNRGDQFQCDLSQLACIGPGSKCVSAVLV